MKLTLNLLSEERKKEINNKKRFLIILNQSLLFLLPMICLILTLITINFVLKINSQGLDSAFEAEQNQDSYKKLKEYEDNFSKLNSKVSGLLKIQNAHLRWTKVLESLNLSVSENVYISQIINKDYQISLMGKAKTRDDFLKFKNNLENSECFSDINAPLSDLVAKKDVDFQIDFDIKQDCLKTNN
jgi:Tfp pilus assembly protein PilN